MAEYIERDELLKELCTVSAPTPSESWIVEKCIQKVNEQPTADVVPKSEVDKTIAEWAWLHADVLNKLDNAKAEVAREIFAEIEFDIANLDFDREETRAIAIEGVIANIKEKYIPKDCRVCKHFVGCEQAVWTGHCDDYTEE